MRYRELSGFDSIIAEEPRHALERIADDFTRQAEHGLVRLAVVTPEGKKTLELSPETSLAELVEQAGMKGPVKLVHVGAPLGLLLTPEQLERNSLCTVINSQDAAMWGDLEVRIMGSETCVLSYLQNLLTELRGENCGRCVFCREGIKQVLFALNSATGGKGGSGTLPMIEELAEAMIDASYCVFGKSVGALVKSAAEGFRSEFDDHIKRKRCEAAVCQAYVTYHILPTKCVGCGDCEDACDDDAITGKRGFIYMIDNDECIKCGACLEACEEEAIVIAGPIKPRTPERLTRVGAWRGK